MAPGPRPPRLIQTLGVVVAPPRFIEACIRRYGSAVRFSTLFDRKFVMVFDPELVKGLFRGSPAQLRAGEANAVLGQIVGERSILLLDGDEHLRQRRLMLPAFHGERMPPGPRLPRLIQTLGFVVAPPRFIEACHRRYGSAVPFSTPFDRQFVVVFEPGLA